MVPRRTPQATQELRAALIQHARRLVERDGAQALTMRALAAEAGCAVGLPYKIFANREELVAELVGLELGRLRAAFESWVAEAGTGTVAGNLVRYARILLESDRAALTLADEIDDEALTAVVDDKVRESGLPLSFESAVTDYLLAEQRLGRVSADVDARAYGFLLTGAIHNLVVAGAAYPRPDRDELDRMLAAVARHLGTG